MPNGQRPLRAKDFVPNGQREVPHGVSCSIRDDATASWTTREHLCDTVRGGGEEEGALEGRSTHAAPAAAGARGRAGAV